MKALPAPVRIVVVVAVMAVVAAGVVALSPGSGGRSKVTALFADASPLYPGNEVKAAGVKVGQIDSITLAGGVAHVTMDIDPSILPLHTDSRATITEQDLLGERFVALERGSPTAPGLDASNPVIPVSNTSRTVDLQSVLNGVDNPTGTALASMITTLGKGADQRGNDIAAGFQALKPAMQQSQALSQVLSDQNAVLAHLVDTTKPVLGALASDHGRRLDGVVGSADAALTTVAQQRGAMGDTLARLPGTLISAQKTLATVAGAADDGTSTLAGLRPVTSDLRDISGELRRFSDATDPALASLRPVLDRGRQLIDRAAPVVSALRPAGGPLRAAAGGGREFALNALSGPALGDMMEFVKNWALTCSGYDGLSNWFRVAAITTPKTAAKTAGGVVPGLPEGAVPGLNPPPLPLPGPLAPKPNEHGHSTTDPGSATGMTERQEDGLMNQMLGGR